MSNYTLIRAKGLSTFSNPLSQAVAEGSFKDASNIVIDRNEIIEPRRGITQYGTSFGTDTDLVHQLLNYKDVIIRHVLDKVQFDGGNGQFVDFNSNSINPAKPGLRIKSIEANGNLYFTTQSGIKKISATSVNDFYTIPVTEAGGINALDLTAKPNYSTPGFLGINSKVAYSIVWGQKDLNENLILGKPSSRVVVYNRATEETDTCVVDLEFPIPSDITNTNFFFQVYRTAVFTSDDPQVEAPDPGFEMNLVFEEQVTTGQLSMGIVSTQDITPEDFRISGTLLYTNPISGEGVAQANERPPFATDIALYKQYAFYANTSTIHRMNLAFLTANIAQNSTISITSESGTEVYTFRGAAEKISFSYVGLSPSALAPVMGSFKYFTLTSANNETNYLIYYTDDPSPTALRPSGFTGYIQIMVDLTGMTTMDDIVDGTLDAISNATDDFNLTSTPGIIISECVNNGPVNDPPYSTIPTPFFYDIIREGIGENANTNHVLLPKIPGTNELGLTPGQQLEQMAKSFVRVVTKTNPDVLGVYLSGYDEVPGQILLENRNVVGPQFNLNSSFGTYVTPELPNVGKSAISSSSNEVRPNRIYYSKYQQPEAVPLANYFDIGPKDREIKRIIALRDSLFVLKEDGIYRISGETAPFTVSEFDFSTQVLAPDTAVVLNNQIYALSTLGVIVITESGVEVVSRQIENKLLQIMKFQNYKTAGFGVSYESDKAYILFLPEKSIDSVATVAYRFNVFTNTWTKWDVSHTCGIVEFGSDTMFLGAGDINYVEKERKTLTRMDHADRQYQIQILNNGVDGRFLKVNDLSRFEVNDVVIQTQYLTTSQYNRILLKLDLDNSVPSTDYYATLEAFAGDNMRSKLVALATKLDVDLSIVGIYVNSIKDETVDITNITFLPQGSRLTLLAPPDLLATRILKTNTNEILTITAVGPTYVDVAERVVGNPTIAQIDVNNFIDLQACFNIIVDLLNVDPGVFYSNYPKSVGSVNQESPVVAIDKSRGTIELKFAMGFILGELTLYKSIKSSVNWNPIYFGDPTLLKHIREGTMFFENSNFSAVTIGYGTDLSPSFNNILFTGEGLSVGDWGYFGWGTINWGGEAAPIPLRTLIPMDKQRCRFINIQFQHSVAFEKYAIYGLGLTFRTTGNKAYR